MFCTAYNDYRSGNYLMAEDLLGLEMKLFPVMFYSTANNSRFIYLRDVITSYDYVYVTESELSTKHSIACCVYLHVVCFGHIH